MTALEQIWPPFALRIEAGPLELRAVRDADICALADLALAGIHHPAAMPFAMPWTDAPGKQLIRNMATYYWTSRAEFSAASWTLDLVVRLRGEVVGVQGLSTRDYVVTRTGETGSWLGLAHQGNGIGTLMRQTLCAFLFDYLDAAEVTSAAFTDNPTSLAVSRKVGYTHNGSTRERRRDGELATSQKLRLTPDALIRGPAPLQVAGVEALREAIDL